MLLQSHPRRYSGLRVAEFIGQMYYVQSCASIGTSKTTIHNERVRDDLHTDKRDSSCPPQNFDNIVNTDQGVQLSGRRFAT